MFKREDSIVGIVSVIIGVFVLFVSSSFSERTSLDTMGPGGMPVILAWMMIIIGIIHIVGAYSVPKTGENFKAKYAKEFEEAKVIMQITLVCALYILLLDVIGYLIATPLLIIGIMWVVNVRNTKKLLSTSIVTTIVLFLIFGVVLGVRLPMGFLDSII